MAEQKLYISCGEGHVLPLYAKSCADGKQWATWGDSDMRDRYTPVIIELLIDPVTGSASARFIKNDFERPAS